MPVNLTRKVYTFVWSKDSMRHATIIFNATAPNKWMFESCSFSGVSAVYTLDDWEFLEILAAEIKTLCKKEGVI